MNPKMAIKKHLRGNAEAFLFLPVNYLVSGAGVGAGPERELELALQLPHPCPFCSFWPFSWLSFLTLRWHLGLGIATHRSGGLRHSADAQTINRCSD